MQPDGRTVRGELDAAGLDELEQGLRERGLSFINGEAARPPLWRARLPRRELMHLCFHLEQLLDAGVPIVDSLAELRETTRHARLRDIVVAMLSDISAGKPLSEAAARHPAAFDAVFVSLLRAGEHAGTLPETIRDIGSTIERDDELAAHARRVAIYPAIVGGLLGVALLVALTHVVPELEKLFRTTGQTLPLQTRVLLWLSHAVAAWGWALAMIAAAAAAGLRVALARSAALRLRRDFLLLRLPLIGELRRKLALARFAALFATLYAAGINVIDALRTSEDITGNLALREGLRSATLDIEQGRTISQAFASTGLFPPLVTRMLRLGEQTGGLDRALANVSNLYRRDVSEAIARLQASLEPALTVTMGALLLWIATAVLGPIYDILTHLPV
ncbi:type II secretion system protein [Thauera sinica]|nr:type II secretion system protein [Thauera sp. K11]